jgi:3-dehydroquinate synthase
MAADLSHRLGWITDTELARIVDLVRAAGLPATPPRGIATGRFLELMAVDKKVLDGRLRLVLLEGIGKALITDGFPLQALRDTLEAA